MAEINVAQSASHRNMAHGQGSIQLIDEVCIKRRYCARGFFPLCLDPLGRLFVLGTQAHLIGHRHSAIHNAVACRFQKFGVPGKYVPGRRQDDKQQVIQLMNFKGGSAKSTATIHLCHYLALQGYCVLAVDLDPQGSLTGFCGLQTELEFDGPTVYDALRYEEALPLSDVIVDTYFPGLDLAPAGLILSEFETETAVNAGRGAAFFERLSTALDPVQDNYDVVIIDSPPALGFLTLTGLYAATSVLVPMTPSMLDLASTQQFIEMTSAYLGVIEDTGVRMDHDFFSFL